MSEDSWSVHLRWAPWFRVVRLRLAGERRPRLSEGPISVVLRFARLLLPVPVLLAGTAGGDRVAARVPAQALPPAAVAGGARAAGSAEMQVEVRGMFASVRARRELTARYALQLPPPSLVRRVPGPVS
ncbi:hypothetical protein FDZ84_20670 [Saccharopolyspora sp. ASAGF58]|nr:hypothetical protein FDZ84_20670 [Saccharopolyspora sp. ASAGF58]